VEREEHGRDPDVRWYSQPDARALFEAAGFEVEQVVGGFTDHPVVPRDEVFTVIAVRP